MRRRATARSVDQTSSSKAAPREARRPARAAFDEDARDAARRQSASACARGRGPSASGRDAQHLDARRRQRCARRDRRRVGRRRPDRHLAAPVATSLRSRAAAAAWLSSTTRTGERSSRPGRRRSAADRRPATVPMPTRMASAGRASDARCAVARLAGDRRRGARAAPAIAVGGTRELQRHWRAARRVIARIWPRCGRRASSREHAGRRPSMPAARRTA